MKKNTIQQKYQLFKPQKNFYRAIIENLYEEGVFTMDKDGIIQHWNVGAEKLFGYKDTEVLGKNCEILFTPEDQKNKIPDKELKHALKKSRAVDERCYVRKDGTCFWASGIVFPIEDEKHAHTGFTKILTDVSEQKDFDKRRDDFISTATHEIRTPITTLKLYADIVKRKVKSIDDVVLNNSVIGLNDQIDRLIALTDYLLDVSKIQAGKLVLEKKYFDINKLVDLLVTTMGLGSSTHTLIKHSNVKKKVFGDEERISQVVTNLLSNAIKYSPKGGQIIITLKQEKESVIVSVEDFGLGIYHDEQHKIFTRFYRADIARKTNITGIGLGLYIARKIINAHHGEMNVRSVKGKGTTFYFTLPSKTNSLIKA